MLHYHNIDTKLPKLGQECIIKLPNGNIETAFFSRGTDGQDKKFITWYGEEVNTKYWREANDEH